MNAAYPGNCARSRNAREMFVWFIWLVSFNQTNETHETNQITFFLLGLRLLRCQRRGFAGEFLVEKFSSENGNPQCNAERDGNEQCGGNICTTEPPHLLKSLEDIGHKPAEIVGDHDNR